MTFSKISKRKGEAIIHIFSFTIRKVFNQSLDRSGENKNKSKASLNTQLIIIENRANYSFTLQYKGRTHKNVIFYTDEYKHFCKIIWKKIQHTM